MTDFLFDPVTGDLRISGGDLVVGDATENHQYDIVTAQKGHYKNNPKRGVGVQNYVNDTGLMPGLTSTIRGELIADGQTVESVTVEPGGRVNINAHY
jgi:hypothetical protein